MKKKIQIILFICLGITILIFLNSKANSTTEEIDQKWSLETKKIERISILGAEQNMNIRIITGDSSENSVHLIGKVSKKSLSHLKKTIVNDKGIEVQLSDYSAPRFLMTNENKNTLQVEIKLSNNCDLEKFHIKSVIGNVRADFPKDFVSTLDLKPKNGGEIVKHSRLKKNGQTKILISTIGNIEY